MQLNLEEIAAGVDRLQSIVLTVMPDCLLYEGWTKNQSDTSTEEVATYFGDLVRANREALLVMKAWSDDMQVTIESGGLLIILRRLNDNYVVGFVFDSDAPLGMVRLHVRKMIDVLLERIPRFEVKEKSRGQKVIDFVERYAPDAHTVLLRVAVQARVPLDELRAPDTLDAEKLERVESAVASILGLESLNL